MLNAYVLEGISKEFLLVVKSDDRNRMLAIIERLRTSRVAWMKDLAEDLERSLYETDDKIIERKMKESRKSPAKRASKKNIHEH